MAQQKERLRGKSYKAQELLHVATWLYRTDLHGLQTSLANLVGKSATNKEKFSDDREFAVKLLGAVLLIRKVVLPLRLAK